MDFEVSKCFEIPYKTALFEFNGKDRPNPHNTYILIQEYSKSFRNRHNFHQIIYNLIKAVNSVKV